MRVIRLGVTRPLVAVHLLGGLLSRCWSLDWLGGLGCRLGLWGGGGLHLSLLGLRLSIFGHRRMGAPLRGLHGSPGQRRRLQGVGNGVDEGGEVDEVCN